MRVVSAAKRSGQARPNGHGFIPEEKLEPFDTGS